jgi:hypothetical protein
MLNSLPPSTKPLSRCVIILMLFVGLVASSGCNTLFGVKKNVNVPPLLGPLAEAATDQLIAEVNRAARVRSIRGNVDIQFQDTSFAESGISEKYRTADGKVILQRPGQVYLSIQLPIVNSDVAQMTSDGQHFRVAVLRGDEKYKRFVRGTNSAVYPKLSMDEKDKKRDGKDKKASEQRAVSALSNLRPQHLTDALLVRAIEPRAQSGLVYAQSEFYLEENATGADARAAKAGGRIVRGYYLLDELTPGGTGGARLTRRFWFDRVGGIRLARLQTFDERGTLITDVAYYDPKPFGEGGTLTLPSRVEITRPHDSYKLSLTYQSPADVTIDRQWQPEIFVLENKWGLPEVDLDKRDNQRSNAVSSDK